MKRRFIGLIIGIICILFSGSSLAQIEEIAQIEGTAFAQVETPKGKTGVDFGNEAKTYVQGISAFEAKSKYDSDKSVLFVDVRRRSEYLEDGFIEGSLDLSLGRLIFDARERISNKDTPLITYCKKGMRAAIAGADLVRMGYTNVKYLAGGILGWKSAGYPIIMCPYYGRIALPTGKTPEDFIRAAKAIAGVGVSPVEAKRRKDSAPDTIILDVALAREHALLGKIEGSLLMEHGKVAFNIKKKIHNANTPIIVICSSGKRAMLITQQLKEMGYKNVTYMQGGLGAWEKAGLPIATFVPGREIL